MHQPDVIVQPLVLRTLSDRNLNISSFFQTFGFRFSELEVPSLSCRCVLGYEACHALFVTPGLWSPALVTYWSCGGQRQCHFERHPCSRPRWIFCSQCSSAGRAGRLSPHFQPERAAAGEGMSQCHSQASPGWLMTPECLAHRLSVGTNELAPGFGAKVCCLGLHTCKQRQNPSRE